MSQPTWIPALCQHIDNLMRKHQIPGLAFGLAVDGRPVVETGFGWRDVVRQLPVTPDTVFGAASLTKSMTALAVMLLQEEGRLSVEDPVVRWLPELRLPRMDWGRRITIHHLLTHTSGLPGMRALFHARAGSIRQDPNKHRLGLVADPDTLELIRTYEDLMALMARSEFQLLGPPGACFNYSNEGYALLQGIIERAGGQPFLTVVQERVLDPLGMTRSVFRTADLEQLENVTELYASVVEDGKKQVFHAPVWWDVAQIYTNGSLKSTVRDLLRYLEVFRCGGTVDGVRILSPESVRRMTTAHVTTPLGRGYGYGLHVQGGYHGVTLVGHSGGIKGVSAHMWAAPERGITVVALANLAGVPAEEAATAGVNAALGLPLETRPYQYPEHPMEPEKLARFAGLYRSEEGGMVRVVWLKDGLYLDTMGQLLPTCPWAEDGVVTRDGTTPVRFLQNEDGVVTGLFMGVRVLRKVASPVRYRV